MVDVYVWIGTCSNPEEDQKAIHDNFSKMSLFYLFGVATTIQKASNWI